MTQRVVTHPETVTLGYKCFLTRLYDLRDCMIAVLSEQSCHHHYDSRRQVEGSHKNVYLQ